MNNSVKILSSFLILLYISNVMKLFIIYVHVLESIFAWWMWLVLRPCSTWKR